MTPLPQLVGVAILDDPTPSFQVDEAEVLVADTSGESVDNRTRLDLIRQQEEFIKNEAEEKEVEVRVHSVNIAL